MATTIIPRRHLRQPQGRVTIDWNNPLSKGLNLSVDLLGMREVVTGTEIYEVNPVAGYTSKTALPDGVGYVGQSASNHLRFSSAALRKPTVQTGFTVLAGVRLGTYWPQDGVPALSWQTQYGVNDGGYDLLVMNSGRPRIEVKRAGDSYISVAASDTVLALNTGRLEHIGGILSGGVARTIYNGVTDSASVAVDSVIYTGLPLIQIGGHFSANNSNAHAHTHAVQYVHGWDRSLSADELLEVRNHPWQLFRADPIRIYSLPSGPITLNSLTMSNITSSGARATLSITR